MSYDKSKKLETAIQVSYDFPLDSHALIAHHSTIMASFVKISITDDVARALQQLRNRYSTLSDSELFRLSLAELSYKVELERRQAWEDSLPVLPLTRKEQEELSETLREADEDPGQIMTVDEIMDEALSDDMALK